MYRYMTIEISETAIKIEQSRDTYNTEKTRQRTYTKKTHTQHIKLRRGGTLSSSLKREDQICKYLL